MYIFVLQNVDIVQKTSSKLENVEIGALPFILPAGVALTIHRGNLLSGFHSEQQAGASTRFSGAVIMDYTH